MGEKIIIEVSNYKGKSIEELSKALADKGDKIEAGSAAAAVAAIASSLLSRAAAVTAESVQNNERLDYIVRNSEILRNYMVYLIDEDVKSRAPLRKAVKGGKETEIDACRHPATLIASEIVNMMGKWLELGKELAALCPPEARQYIAEGTEFAMGAVRASIDSILAVADGSSDETFLYVTRRENELELEQCSKLANEIKKLTEN